MKNYSRQGAALVIVLAVLILIVAMVVGFLTRTTTERRASSVYRSGVHLQTLATTAVNIVQTQITTAADGGNVWASQPGMIRTFDNNGSLREAYKLYSATTLSSTTQSTLRTEDIPPDAWNTQPALWTDLNAWVDFEGERRYPIVDPSLANDNALVEGFNISSSAPTTPIQDAPLPVRWLYVLENGDTVVPTSVSGNKVTVPGSADSPIVGRIAFWTDDETAKVNINTAGDGVYWDAPKAFSPEEGQLADSQPARNEFQRYPGHPATTSLRSVFPFLNGEEILSALTPRYRWGGSEGGTKSTTGATQVAMNSVKDRLYSSVDELIFDRDRDSQSLLTRQQIEQRQFFLTANSRAPELNLFNLPRVAIWPLHAINNAAHRNELDRLIAHASSLGSDSGNTDNPFPYYFQRKDANSPTEDFSIPRNLEIYNYLSTLTSRAVPGFGNATFASKYGANHLQILTEIFDYIRSANLHDPLLGAQSGGVPFTPGWATTGDGKLALVGHGQVSPAKHPDNGTMGFGRFYTISELGLHFICTGNGNDAASNNPETNLTLEEGTPLQAEQKDADGNTIVPAEKRMQAMVVLELFSPAVGWALIRPNMKVTIDGLQNIQVNGVSIFPASANGSTQITARQRELMNARAWGANPGVRYPLLYKYAPARGRIAADATTGNDGYLYPFISDFFTVSGDTMDVSVNSPLTITISDGSDQVIQTIQLPKGGTMSPKATRTPDLPPDSNWWAFSINPAVSGVEGGRLFGLSGRETGNNNYSHAKTRKTTKFFNEKDVVISFIPEHGDYRLVAATPNISAADSPFIPHPSWNSTAHFATSLYERFTNLPFLGLYTATGYLNGVTYNATFTPDNPGGNFVTTGDWDSGYSYLVDGPYINKPDEGTLAREATLSGIQSYPYFGEQVSTSDVSSFFSPTRQMPSSGMFGSLSTGLMDTPPTPWRTLLFRPQSGHFGASNPKDHLLMDLFWMPVVEPYAISEPFSTAGKINMNYEILPFTYLERSTGLYAVLKGEKLAAVPANRGNFYKLSTNSVDSRLDINIAETLKQFSDKFSSGEIFRSASEICDLWIVPSTQNLSGMSAFWNSYSLTGDNLRERIYTTLYPRLTTKSNTYTVHLKVQTLKKAPATSAGEWNETQGTITGEYRGSVTIERYINPNNSEIPDYAKNPDATPGIDRFYRWRTIASSQFAP